MKLSLQLEVRNSLTPSELVSIIQLLEQTSNIQSLSVSGQSFIATDPSSIEKVHSIIIRHVNWSKLRHLEVPIWNLNHIQTLSNRFRNLKSIRFLFDSGSSTSEEVIAFVKPSMPDCSIECDYPVASIWIGKRPENTKDSTKSTSYFRSFLHSLKSLVR
jgi:hypothetical protein